MVHNIEIKDPELEKLKRENIAIQELLGLVLEAHGDKVVITKERLEHGFDKNVQVEILEDLESQTFVIRLVNATELD